MTLQLGSTQILYISAAIIWWVIGYFFSSQEHGGGWFGPSPSDRTMVRFLSLFPFLVATLLIHLLVFA